HRAPRGGGRRGGAGHPVRPRSGVPHLLCDRHHDARGGVRPHPALLRESAVAITQGGAPYTLDDDREWLLCELAHSGRAENQVGEEVARLGHFLPSTRPRSGGAFFAFDGDRLAASGLRFLLSFALLSIPL